MTFDCGVGQRGVRYTITLSYNNIYVRRLSSVALALIYRYVACKIYDLQ